MSNYDEYLKWLEAATAEYREKYPDWADCEIECIGEDGKRVWLKGHFYAYSVELTPWTLDNYAS